MKPALVATDLDGTFLGAGGQAHPGNLAAARAAVEAGIELVVATGRPRRWLTMLDPLLDLDPIVIASNGGSVGRLAADGPSIIHPIPRKSIEAFVAGLPAELEACFAVEYALEWGHEPAYPESLLGSRGVVQPLSELLDRGPIIKLLAHTRELGTEDLAAIALEAAGDGLTCTFSWAAEHGTVELSAQGVSKGAALAEVIDELGVAASECAAFGDMPNDLDMLRLVGSPFVMAGSHPSMFEHGFPVIGEHYDGAVGEQLRRYLA